MELIFKLVATQSIEDIIMCDVRRREGREHLGNRERDMRTAKAALEEGEAVICVSWLIAPQRCDHPGVSTAVCK